MPKKTKTKHQLAQEKRYKANEAGYKTAKRVLDIWAKEYEKQKKGGI